MTGNPNRQRPAPLWALPFLLAGVCLLALAAPPALQAAGQKAGQKMKAPAPPAGAVRRGLALGEEKVLGECLRIRMLNISDRSGPLTHDDWITVRIENDCPTSRRHLLVDLFLFDHTGTPYGARMWMLGYGESLLPGQVRQESFPIPDPSNRLPMGWDVRLVKVEAARPAS